MTSSEIKRSYALPLGFCATFEWGPGGLAVMWEPQAPIIRQQRARRRFRDAYAAARRDFLTEVAAIVGGAILVVDTDGAYEGVTPPTKQ